jgi:hypothetical protein
MKEGPGWCAALAGWVAPGWLGQNDNRVALPFAKLYENILHLCVKGERVHTELAAQS